MKEKTSKLITFVCLGLAILATVFAIIFALDISKYSSLYNVAYGITGAFVVLSIAAIVIFALVQWLKNFKNDRKKAMKSLYVIALAVIVCIVAFLLAKGNDVSNVLLEKNNISEATSRLIGAACILVYILVGAAADAIVYVEVSKSFKKK